MGEEITWDATARHAAEEKDGDECDYVKLIGGRVDRMEVYPGDVCSKVARGMI